MMHGAVGNFIGFLMVEVARCVTKGGTCDSCYRTRIMRRMHPRSWPHCTEGIAPPWRTAQHPWKIPLLMFPYVHEFATTQHTDLRGWRNVASSTWFDFVFNFQFSISWRFPTSMMWCVLKSRLGKGWQVPTIRPVRHTHTRIHFETYHNEAVPYEKNETCNRLSSTWVSLTRSSASWKVPSNRKIYIWAKFVYQTVVSRSTSPLLTLWHCFFLSFRYHSYDKNPSRLKVLFWALCRGGSSATTLVFHGLPCWSWCSWPALW